MPLILLFTVSILGILGMTWLFPLTGYLFSRKSSPSRKALSPATKPISGPQHLSILIPVHNEEKILGKSLKSISSAIDSAQEKFPSVDFEIILGADNCTDRSTSIARNWKLKLIEFTEAQGKWKTLTQLLSLCPQSNWVILADAGVLWDKNFLIKILASCQSNNVMAMTPAYRSQGGGMLEMLLWQIEGHFKKLESRAGGAISLHGATVIYRRKELMQALSILTSANWRNDDIVLPLCMRMLNPDKKVLYLNNIIVRDAGTLNDRRGSEFRRRKRMVIGNIEWIQKLLPLALRSNFTVFILCLRRVFRLFWAYWLLFFSTSALLICLNSLSSQTLKIQLLSMAGLLMTLLMLLASNKVLFNSALTSFLSPLYFIRAGKINKGTWK